MSRFAPLRAEAVDRLAPGLYAWMVTVALPCGFKGAPLAARLAALVAVIALTSAGLLAVAAPRAARALGVWVFVGCSVASWALFPASLAGARLDPVQGALGSLGWALYALSWAGERSGAPASPSLADDAPRPRSSPVGPARLVFISGALVASLPMLLAWWVPGVERALFAHGSALAIGIALVVTATRIVDRERPAGGPRKAPSVAMRLGSAVITLLALSLLLLAGAGLRLLR